MRYPPIVPGTQVRTTKADLSARDEWTDEGWNKRQWDVDGIVGRHHTGHGLCYEVTHSDGTVAHYNPTEIEVLPSAVSVNAEDIQDAMELLGQPD